MLKNWLQVSADNNTSNFAQDYERFRDQESNTEPEIRAEEDDLLYIMYTSGTWDMKFSMAGTSKEQVIFSS